ncbi:MAG: sigma-70 family RNA polymerase sigma factor [Terracidiphilus sp.]|jgi:RNA polymerase sigma-70 factor (ECF subfamily)
MSFGRNVEQIPEPFDLTSCPEEQLVQSLVSGNHDAMSVIFDRYYAIMMRVALRIVRDHGEAEDAVQIAFTDFYRNAKLFDATKGSLRTWLLQYTYGRSINRLNGLKSRNRFNHVELADVDPSELAADIGEHFRLTSQEAKLFVEQLLESLDAKHRRVVELICFCGLTILEVARITGESVGNVQHHYYRSLERFRIAFRDVQVQEQEGQATKQRRRSVWSLCKTSKSAEALTGEVESVKAQIL